ncbi:MAG: hypothetical protein ACKVZ0_05750 [Gemmatimonadales bacterium]
MVADIAGMVADDAGGGTDNAGRGPDNAGRVAGNGGKGSDNSSAAADNAGSGADNSNAVADNAGEGPDESVAGVDKPGAAGVLDGVRGVTCGGGRGQSRGGRRQGDVDRGKAVSGSCTAVSGGGYDSRRDQRGLGRASVGLGRVHAASGRWLGEVSSDRKVSSFEDTFG